MKYDFNGWSLTNPDYCVHCKTSSTLHYHNRETGISVCCLCGVVWSRIIRTNVGPKYWDIGTYASYMTIEKICTEGIII